MKTNFYLTQSARLFLRFCFAIFLINSQAQHKIILTQGSSFTATDSAVLTCYNLNFENHGLFHAGNSTVVIKGDNTTDNSLITGSSVSTFCNLTLDKSSHDTQLKNDIIVTSRLRLMGGNVNINARNIDLKSSGALIGETDTTRIYGSGGKIMATNRTVDQGDQVNIGNCGIILQPTSGNLFQIDVIRGVDAQSLSGETSIQRYFDISAVSDTQTTVNVLFNFFDSEKSSLSGTHLNNSVYTLWSSDDNGEFWNSETNSESKNANTIGIPNVDNINKRWTAGPFAPAALALTIDDFSVSCNEGKPLLKWTADHTQNSTELFKIMNSSDGMDWQVSDTIVPIPFQQEYFYQVTGDNPRDEYFKIITFNSDSLAQSSSPALVNPCKKDLTGSFQIYPNPASTVVNFKFSGAYSTLQLYLYSADGRLILEKEGTQVFEPLHIERQWGTGLFIARVLVDHQMITKPFVVY